MRHLKLAHAVHLKRHRAVNPKGGGIKHHGLHGVGVGHRRIEGGAIRRSDYKATMGVEQVGASRPIRPLKFRK